MSKKTRESVKVMCRFRPFNALESKKKSVRSVEVNGKNVRLTNQNGKHKFIFDHIFDEDSKQEDVYGIVGKPIVDYMFNGYNGTIFCYGQTGSGKTYTMMGPNAKGSSGYCDDQKLKGLIPRIVEQIFETIQSKDENIEFMIQVSYIEIYMEKLRDLLNAGAKNLQIREDRSSGRGIYVEGVNKVYCSSVDEVFQYMKRGASIRVVASHTMNQDSSRSHSVFMIEMVQKHLIKGETKSGKLFLVDLAGSESVKKTGAEGLLLNQAKHINRSLSALGNVINALTDGKSRHIPYRDSKLTRLLTDSLGGNSKTFLIINCSPSSYNSVETLSTLRFGMRAKSIKNKAKINTELDAKTLRRLLNKANATIKKQKSYIRALEKQMKTGEFSNTVDDDNPFLIELKKKNEDYENELNLKNKAFQEMEEDKERIREEFLEAKEKLEKQMLLVESLEEDLKLKTDMHLDNEVLENEVQMLKAKLQKVEYEKNEQYITIENLKKSLENSQKELEKGGKKPFPDITEALMSKYSSDKGLKLEEYNGDTPQKTVTVNEDGKKVTKIRTVLLKKKRKKRRKKKKRGSNEVSSAPNTPKTSGTNTSEVNEDGIHKKIEFGELTSPVQNQKKLSNLNEPNKKEKDNIEDTKKIGKEYLEGVLNKHKESTLFGNVQEAPNTPKSNAMDNEEEDDDFEDENGIRKITPREFLRRKIESLKKKKSSLFSQKDFSKVNPFEYIKDIESENIQTSIDITKMKERLRIAKKNAETVRNHLEKQKYALMRDLRNRCDKVVELEMMLDEIKDKYEHVLYISQRKDSSKRIIMLEKKCQKLSLSHQKFASENSTLKLKIKMLENKLKIRNERIKNLEKSLEEVIDKNNVQTDKHIKDRAKLIKENEKQAREVDRFKSLLNELSMNVERRLKSENSPKVVKVMRGGNRKSIDKVKKVMRRQSREVTDKNKRKSGGWGEFASVLKKINETTKESDSREKEETERLFERSSKLELELKRSKGKGSVKKTSSETSMSDRLMKRKAKIRKRRKNNTKRVYSLTDFILDSEESSSGNSWNIDFSKLK